MYTARNAANAERFNRIYAGDITGYPSTSEADHDLIENLCFYSISNEQVRRLFLASQLGKRDKHHRHNGYHVNLSIKKCRAKHAANKRKKQIQSKALMSGLHSAIDKMIEAKANQTPGGE